MITVKRVAFPLLVLVGFGLAFGCLFFLQDRIKEARSDVLDAGDQAARDRLIELGSTVMLGSFKTALVDSLWYRADVLKERREWAELDGVIRFIARVQPTDVPMYDHYIWHMAYNIQFDAPTVVEAWKWVKRAIEFGERGAARNPNHPQIWKLYWQIGWTYFHRCGELTDDRTRYFRQQVINEHGKSPFLVAADWFKKAWIAATDTPGAKSPNVHNLSMWALAYDRYAARLARDGDIVTMLAMRRKSIEVHNIIATRLPEGKDYADQQTERLSNLIRLYTNWQAAEKLRKLGDVAGELELLLKLANDWSAVLLANPQIEEAQQNVDGVANRLEDLTGLIIDPAKRESVLRRAMEMRFLAADPRRRDDVAAGKLRESVRYFDKKLGSSLARPDLLANAELIPAVSSVWARIALNSPGDKALVASAAKAIHRYDRLYEVLSDDQKKSHLLQLCDQWYRLIWATDVDSPTARGRVRTAALGFEQNLLPACRAVIPYLRVLEKGASPAQQQQAVAQITHITPQLHGLTDAATKYWFALLRKDAHYRIDAKAAEQHLRTIAETLELTANAAEAVLGPARSVRHKADPRSLHTPAGSIWQMLRQFNPRNPLYAEKAGRAPKSQTGPINIHDLPGHEHDESCGHAH